jgi:spermidine dehydrogenase
LDDNWRKPVTAYKITIIGSPTRIVARRLGGERPITRRDFIDGIAVAAAVAAVPCVLTAGYAGLTASAPQDRPDYNPPTLTGMRGSHPGSFEAAHAVRDGTFPKAGASPTNTGEHYDLIVVGGGISGLAAAYFYRAATGPDARILILDNHDDFGGHAKRNEFELDGRIQLINGGTLGIDSNPALHSDTVASGTKGSNPSCSSSQSVSALNTEAVGKKSRTLAAVCGWLGT